MRTPKITDSKNEKKDIAIDPTDLKRLIRGYYEQLYPNKFDNLDEFDHLDVHFRWTNPLGEKNTKVYSTE